MKPSVQWIEYKGKKILFCDFSGIDENQYMTGVDMMEKELLAQPPGSNVPLLIDVSNSRMTLATRDRGKKTVDVLLTTSITTKTVMIGITGLQKLIAQAISRDVHYANDLDSAKDWLANQ